MSENAESPDHIGIFGYLPWSCREKGAIPGCRPGIAPPPGRRLGHRSAASAAAPLPGRRPDHCPASPPRRLMSRFAATPHGFRPHLGAASPSFTAVLWCGPIVRGRTPACPSCPPSPCRPSFAPPSPRHRPAVPRSPRHRLAIALPSLVRPLSPRHFLAVMLPLNTRDRVSARCSCRAFRHPGCSHIDRGS